MDLVVHDAGDADPARLGDPLQPRGDVDAVAVNVAVFDDHITRVDADAELDARVLGGGIVACCHPPLHCDGAGDRFDDTREFNQDSIAGGLYDASLGLISARLLNHRILYQARQMQKPRCLCRRLRSLP